MAKAKEPESVVFAKRIVDAAVAFKTPKVRLALRPDKGMKDTFPEPSSVKGPALETDPRNDNV